MNKTILDELLSKFPVQIEHRTITITEDEIVHVVGAQEPVRDQPDERARALLRLGWLEVGYLHITLPASERRSLVDQVQELARNWLAQKVDTANALEHQQIRWMVEKTRPHESKQQIAHRLWLAIALYGQNCRGLRFDAEGQIHWEDGIAGRVGLSPDELIDLIWAHNKRAVYAASFRAPNGTIARGKGRHRWYIYKLVIDPKATPLFEHRHKKVDEKIALVVASESYATQPQLPRDFYGGDEFQQACIDAQDQHFDHIFVLSPEHGIVSLDDTVPTDITWNEVLEQHIWRWQMLVVQRLGKYLFRDHSQFNAQARDMNWWLWLNPESTFRFTVFGGGFAVRVLFDHLLRARTRTPRLWPHIVLEEYRQGYIVGDFEEDYDLDLDFDDNLTADRAFELAVQDIDQLLEWATDFVHLVTIRIPPKNEMWNVAPDEALIPMRLLADSGVDVDNLLDLLTDITLLLEQPVPLDLFIRPGLTVSTLLQLTHNLIHNEHDMLQDLLNVLPGDALHQYIEKALQEPQQEDRLCACLTLTEQMQLIDLSLSDQAAEQLFVWMQTYISTRVRQQFFGDEQHSVQ